MWSKFLKIATGGGIEAEIKPKFIDFLLVSLYCTVGANLFFSGDSRDHVQISI